MDTFAEQIRTQLAAHTPGVKAEWNARPAAVLIPLYHDQGEWHVLFTERTQTVEDHKGQVAFPGGRVDEGDASRVATALRETEEEIGLQPADVTVLGQLDELLTVTQYRITPVVGVFPWPYPFVLSTEELSEVFGVPLAWLLDPANCEIQYREPPITGPKIPVYYFRYQRYTIWGVTARMLMGFLELIKPLPG